MTAVTIFFWVFLGMNVAWWLHMLRQHAHTSESIAEVWSGTHPCAVHSHRYVKQPPQWRCPACGDTCTVEDVYDQDCVA